MQTFSVRFPGIWLNIVCNNIIKRKIWHSTFRRFNHFAEAAVDVKTEFGWRVVWGGRVIGGKFSIYSPSPEALKENYFSENGRCMYVSTTHVCIYAWYKRDSKELFAILYCYSHSFISICVYVVWDFGALLSWATCSNIWLWKNICFPN